jgi:hypothetical protein
MEVAALLGFRVWLRSVAQAVMSLLVHCLGEFASPLTVAFLVGCGMLCHRDTAEIVNNITYVLFDPVM